MASRDGLALAMAFSQVNDAKLRSGIVDLVEKIVGATSKAPRRASK
jgi:hypothetical protein